MLKEVLVPDIGAYSNVSVIEVAVSVGDVIEIDTTLITLETDKAALEVPAPFGGIVKTVDIKVGDKVSQGSLILTVETKETRETAIDKELSVVEEIQPIDVKETLSKETREVLVPDIGAYSNVPVVEVAVSVGDVIEVDTALVTLETDKAALEVPAPFGGIVKTVDVKIGDKVSQGSLILTVETNGNSVPLALLNTHGAQDVIAVIPLPKDEVQNNNTGRQGIVHAGPGVRRFARELGVDLKLVKGLGPKNRILKQDVQTYVKTELTRAKGGNSGFVVAPWPQLDFAKFGQISREPLSRIKKLSGTYLHRNWVMVPHVTQFDEADITELEQFRKEQQSLAEQQGVKLTPLVFIMKAVVASLKAFPIFNASLDENAGELILKKYFHIGVAVDTPNGLVVPVVRDVEKKGLFQLAKELAEWGTRARGGLLTAQDMQGSSFSISSLGGIGGTAFTPIINVPDVAILGVSKARMQPVYEEEAFKPRLLLPLSLSYDHRVIDGAEAARFITFLAKQLADIRQLLL